MKGEKEQLRERMRAEANRHSVQERAEGSRLICERIQQLEVWRNARSVLLFVPTEHEPDISPLMKAGKRVSLPAFNEKLRHYEAREVADELVPGKFGIPEPTQSSPLASALDVVIAPGIAFCLDGTRLGRGKGFYDRLLAELKAAKIGVCFDWQVLASIPRDTHDIMMDRIVAPTLSA